MKSLLESYNDLFKCSLLLLEHLVSHELDEALAVEAWLDGGDASRVLLLYFGLPDVLELLLEVPGLQVVNNAHVVHLKTLLTQDREGLGDIQIHCREI